MRRRLLLILAALCAVFVVAILAMPLWLGAALSAAGGSRGLTFSRYERLGYGRFALHDVEFRRANVRVTATRAEADAPLVWGWRHMRGAPKDVRIERWLVDVQRPATPSAPKAASGWVPLQQKLHAIAAQLERWLPRAEAGAGVVRFPGGELTLAAADWAERRLAVKELAYRNLKADATITFARDGESLRAEAKASDGGFALESRGPTIAGDFKWWDQVAKVSATFASRGWLPPRASFEASDWKIPGARIKLGEAYATVRGNARVDWDAEHFIADITATGEPVADKKNVPPLEVAIRGKGDARTFNIEALNATLPGISARLSEPVVVDRAGKIQGNPARFTVQADLAKQPWFAAQGAVEGEARVSSSTETIPRIEFDLRGREVAARELSVRLVDVRGQLAWPQLEIASGQLVGGEGERIEFRGGWDFKAKEIRDARVDGQVRRSTLARWLPAQPEFDAVTVKAEASGPVAALVHSGRAQIERIKFRTVNAAALDVDWRGRGAVIESFATQATSGATKLHAAGEVDANGVVLRELELTRQSQPLLRLVEPSVVKFRPALAIESLQLTGPEGNLNAAIVWGESGRIAISMRNIASEWFADLLETRMPAWRLSLLAITGKWDNGPMTYSVTGGASVDLGEGRSAAVNVAARGDGDGMDVEALRALESDAPVIQAVGRIPLVIHPRGAKFIQFDPNGVLRVDAHAAPNAAFWQKLAAATGVAVKEPEVTMRLTGTWQRPEGEVRAKAAGLTVDAKRVKRELPAIEGVNIHLTGDRGGVKLETFVVNIEGQRLRAQGRLPVPDGGWGELFKKPLAVAERGADLRVEVPEAEVAVFTRFLPAFLAPKGRLQMDVTYKNGTLDGFLRLRDAASRPLGPLGVLQEVNADLALKGRRLELRDVSAKSGGQPVALTGTVDVPVDGQPRFNLRLRGENLPFVRQTGLLVRGDLDLKLAGDAKAARISGGVRLRDSLFLQDVRAFLPRGGGGGSRRPPYFEVDTPPVNAWTLAVDISGERFMRLRTPAFNGFASARFRLSGTLGEPRMLGEVTIDEGRVRMPFASFEVKQGVVRLTEENPYEPTIYLRSTGRRYGYDVTMEIEGMASSPNVMFTSSPALESEQVLLMVMTGAAPQSEITRMPTQRMAQIGAYLGQSLLGSDLGQSFLGPLAGDATDADRVTIASGEKVSREGKETLDVEVRLTDRWAVVAERNEFDELNAGVRWRILPRKTEAERRRETAKKEREAAAREAAKHAQK